MEKCKALKLFIKLINTQAILCNVHMLLKNVVKQIQIKHFVASLATLTTLMALTLLSAKFPCSKEDN